MISITPILPVAKAIRIFAAVSEFVHAFNHDTKYNWNFDEKSVREYLEKADKEGLLKLDGDKVTFSSHLSKMGKWNFE